MVVLGLVYILMASVLVEINSKSKVFANAGMQTTSSSMEKASSSSASTSSIDKDRFAIFG